MELSGTFQPPSLGVVDRIITNLAVLDVGQDGLLLRELAPGVTAEEVIGATEPKVTVADDCREMRGL